MAPLNTPSPIPFSGSKSKRHVHGGARHALKGTALLIGYELL